MSYDQPKILLTGATGYIGGSVLAHILKSNHPLLKDTVITCLLRGDATRFAKLQGAHGNRINAVAFQGLDDRDRMIEVATQHDIVINTTHGFHLESALALVDGLAKRKQQTGRDVFMIQTSGTSNLSDLPISKKFVEANSPREFDDAIDDIYAYEKWRNESDVYDQRTAELGVIDRSLETSVTSIVLMAPLIYGIGAGEFNKHSVQVPTYAKAALKAGHGVTIEGGKTESDNVHIDDLSELYTMILIDLIDTGGKGLPTGENGIIFAGSGRHTWSDVAQGVATAAYTAGILKKNSIQSVSLQEGADLFVGGHLDGAERNLSTNARTKATIAKRLGWRPKMGLDAFTRGFAEEVQHEMERIAIGEGGAGSQIHDSR